MVDERSELGSPLAPGTPGERGWGVRGALEFEAHFRATVDYFMRKAFLFKLVREASERWRASNSGAPLTPRPLARRIGVNLLCLSGAIALHWNSR